jgi:transposase
MKNITYKEIAQDLDKSEATIKNWKQKFPKLLKYVKIGAFCKKNGITIEHIKKCVELHELAAKDNK